MATIIPTLSGGAKTKTQYHFDPSSGTWLYLRAEIDEQLKAARAELEAQDTTPERTIALRERIATLKAIVALADPEPVIHDGGDYA